MNKATYVTILVIAFVLFVAGYFTYQVLEQNDRDQLNESAASEALITDLEASYTDIDGNPISLNGEIGKILVVTAWASWCPQCVEQLQSLSDLQENVSDDVRILAINRAEPKSTARSFLQTIDANNLFLVLDPTDHFFNSIGGYNMPETLVYREDGSVLFHGRGRTAENELRYILETYQRE